MEKNVYFISGLPQSGSTLITNILNQNPNIHGEVTSSLSKIFGSVNSLWFNIEENQKSNNNETKKEVLKFLFQSYYSQINKPNIIDKSYGWIPIISQVEDVLEKQIKIIVCVRNPAEILTSFERNRKENPLFFTKADAALGEKSSIASRAFYYAGPDGLLGITHRNLQDAITMNYLDRLLFVDYNRFCNSPKSQTKRIYDFLELPNYEHDFTNLDRSVINCVEYLGLNLYEQYNREIFWNALI